MSDLMLSPKEMAKYGEDSGLYKLNKSFGTSVLSAIAAGVFISIGFACYVLVVTSNDAAAASGALKFLGGATFSLGLMLVVICGADLFTSTVLTILPKLTGQAGWGKMFKNWIIIYIGNFIGALFFVFVLYHAMQPNAMNGQWGATILSTAQHKMHHGFFEAVCLGFLANLMVCLAVWLSYAGKTVMDKAFIMILPIAMFVGNGFEHSIANMFMIPFGIAIKNGADDKFWAQIGQSAESFNDLNVPDFLVHNLIPVTIGNILGGLAVALIYWAMYLKQK